MPKPTSRMFNDVKDWAYDMAFAMLEKARKRHPSYRDDELLMYILSKLMEKEKL